MRTVFADTYYFLALWNPQDSGHAKAMAFTVDYREAMLTTDWVIVELADALSRPPNRGKFVTLYQTLTKQEELIILPATRSQVQEGFALYESRSDKEWSLTDCISFTVMRQEGITEALTADHLFEQAGFVALLK